MLRLQLERRGDAIEIFYWDETGDFRPFRLTYVRDAPALQVGIMGASPEGPGFIVTFANYVVQQLLGQSL
jgi:uncharacterized protein